MNILHRDDLVEGGFAGLKEHRLIKDAAAFGPAANADGSWSGLGNFVYLSDARFMPHGETHMHEHFEVDVISVMIDGNIAHQGSLGHGQNLQKNDVQVQRAGGEGFSHNEINPDDHWNRMIQLWVLPEKAGQAANYKVYRPASGGLTPIYGGKESANNDFPSRTHIDLALLDAGQRFEIAAPFITYLCCGAGLLNNETIQEGDLVRGEKLQFEATEAAQLIVVHMEN
jgi:redox-sensitive bicupin YhaK (pirin superfamily)